MTALLIAIAALLTDPPAGPLVDEGDRWESATLVRTFDDSGPKLARLVFWRRDSFGRIWAAGETDWDSLLNWHAAGGAVRFTWYDSCDDCWRTLLVPRFDWVVVDLDRWRVSWPSCPSDLRGVLPNPEKRDP